MLQLFLLRHGKATKYQDVKSDFDRHLNKHGIAQVNQVGYILKNAKTKIERIISSDAMRTVETAEIMNHYLNAGKIVFDHSLYLASKDVILHKISKTSKAENILYVGHNNGISDLAGYLTGCSVELSTSELHIISFDFSSWDFISGSSGTLVETIKPDVHSF